MLLVLFLKSLLVVRSFADRTKMFLSKYFKVYEAVDALVEKQTSVAKTVLGFFTAMFVFSSQV